MSQEERTQAVTPGAPHTGGNIQLLKLGDRIRNVNKASCRSRASKGPRQLHDTAKSTGFQKVTRPSSQHPGTVWDEVQAPPTPRSPSGSPAVSHAPSPEGGLSAASRAGAETSRPGHRRWEGGIHRIAARPGVNAPGDSLAASACSRRRGDRRAGEDRALGATSAPAPAPVLTSQRPEGESPRRAPWAARRPRVQERTLHAK